jgi:hypothetical protein
MGLQTIGEHQSELERIMRARLHIGLQGEAQPALIRLLSCERGLRSETMDGHGMEAIAYPDMPLPRPTAGREKHGCNGRPNGLIARPKQITRADLPLLAFSTFCGKAREGLSGAKDERITHVNRAYQRRGRQSLAL